MASRRTVKRIIQISQLWRRKDGALAAVRQVHRHEGTAQMTIVQDPSGGPIPRFETIPFYILGSKWEMTREAM